jgi:serine O-acetyltransferase
MPIAVNGSSAERFDEPGPAMIESRQDYLAYLEADRVSLGQPYTRSSYWVDDVWRFQRLLRKVEYLTNCNGNFLRTLWARFRFKRISARLGFTIPPNTCGPGLSIAHYGTIVINSSARVGANCRLHVCVNIGTQAGVSGAIPKIGDNCYIGPGAKIFGGIEIGNNTTIGANAVVNASFPEGNATIAGIPATVVADRSSEGLLIKGYQSDDL